jgi:peroxiredoxin
MSFRDLPDGLPAPVDDGAADHLPGSPVPHVSLPSTLGGSVDLGDAAQALAVVYVYPRTGKPGEPLPPGWDDIPGARGCTPQSCSFRDHAEELSRRGATVIGVSAQLPGDQREFAAREHIPYPLLSDSSLELAGTMGLPVFDVGGMRLYRRLTFIARNGSVEKVFYPVFPPDRNAEEVLDWLPTSA